MLIMFLLSSAAAYLFYSRNRRGENTVQFSRLDFGRQKLRMKRLGERFRDLFV